VKSITVTAAFSALLATHLSALDVSEPSPGFFERTYKRVTFDDLMPHPSDFTGREICVDGYLLLVPGVTDGGHVLALYESRIGNTEWDQKRVLGFTVEYTPALRPRFEGKHVRLCGVYFAPRNWRSGTLCSLIRIDSVRELDSK
jgi:hypothetical protein